MPTTPYTYLLTHQKTGMVYYGVRFREGCNPDELLVDYFSSSKVVKEMIFEGEEFVAEVRKTFSTKEAAIAWETKVLRRLGAAKHPRFLNKHNNGVGFFHHTPHSEYSKKKMSDAAKGRPGYWTGKVRKFSEEHLSKLRSVERAGNKNPFYGKKHTPEAILKMSLARKAFHDARKQRAHL